MKNERNPQIGSVGSGMQKRLMNFSRALSRNEQDVYQYILLMVRGDFQTQESNCDCIFAHLRNILTSEMNTNVLKYASRFITTLLLIGNLHIYEKFIFYLLPIFKIKIQQQKDNNKLRPVWPLELYCRELLFIMSQWLPYDFYQPNVPSPFAKAVDELGLYCEQFKFMNVDKIIISYRIIKALGLDQPEDNCRCQNCRRRLASHHHTPILSSNQQMRQKLYVIHSKHNNRKDSLFETGFQISIEEASGLEDMMELKLKSFSTHPPQDSLIFFKLREKIQVLQDDIRLLKAKSTSKKSQKQSLNPFQTPKKWNKLAEGMISSQKYSSRKAMSPLADLQQVKSLPNLQLLALSEDFTYINYQLFKDIGLKDSQLQVFKRSLLCFNEKVYLQKENKAAIYCLAISKSNRVKIRVSFEGDQNCLADYSVDIDNTSLNYSFNQEKYQYTVKITHYLEPLRMILTSTKGKTKVTLPVGHVKLLEPLPDSAVEEEKLTFKLTKTVKMQNKLISTYEQLVSSLRDLQKLLQKAHSIKINRIFEGQKLKKKLQRRYRLFESDLLLVITNNHTQYIDLEVRCQDRNIHRRNACQLLKELIFICSPPH